MTPADAAGGHRDHVVARFLSVADGAPHRPALGARVDGQWQTQSFGELAARVRRLSQALIFAHLLPSETAVVMAPNQPEWFVAHLSVLAASGVAVPVDDTSSDEEIFAIIRETEARVVLVAGRRGRAAIARLRPRLASLRLVVTLDDVPAGPGAADAPTAEEAASSIGWSRLARATRHPYDLHDDGAEGPAVVPLSRLEQLPYDLATAAEARQRSQTWSGSDVAAVHYAPGASGRLRGVVIRHCSMLYPLDAIPTVFRLPDEPSLVVAQPLSQVMEFWAALTVLLSGGVVWFPDADDAFHDILLDRRPTVVVTAVPLVEQALRHVQDDVQRRLGVSDALVDWAFGVAAEVSALRAQGRAVPPTLAMTRRAAELRVIGPMRARLGGPKAVWLLGGQSMPSPELVRFLRTLGQAPATAWGSRETCAMATLNPPDTFAEGSVGHPLPGTDIQIDEAGQILVRGPGIMLGYYGRPEETRAALRDGWLASGQPGRLDESGALYLTSRVDDVILSSSLRYTSARPLEATLEENPVVAQAVVVGEARSALTVLVHPDVVALRSALRTSGALLQAAQDITEPYVDPLARYSDEEVVRLPSAVRLVGDLVRRANEGRSDSGQIQAFRLVLAPLGPTSVTGEAMSRRERALQDHADVIESMYADLDAAASSR